MKFAVRFRSTTKDPIVDLTEVAASLEVAPSEIVSFLESWRGAANNSVSPYTEHFGREIAKRFDLTYDRSKDKPYSKRYLVVRTYGEQLQGWLTVERKVKNKMEPISKYLTWYFTLDPVIEVR